MYASMWQQQLEPEKEESKEVVVWYMEWSWSLEINSGNIKFCQSESIQETKISEKEVYDMTVFHVSQHYCDIFKNKHV